MASIEDLLGYLLEERGSDLLVKVGSSPVLRRNGKLEHMPIEPLEPATIEQLAVDLLPEHKLADFDETGEVDLAYGVPGLGRFRINVYRQRGSVTLAIRRVVPGAPAISDLGVPPIVGELASHRDGLVLVSGPASSGKTTTAAAMIDQVNGGQARHIVTIEDPIEVLHTDRTSVVSQREVGTDTTSVADALGKIARQDADVVFVSDLPDAASITAALSAAASGRLVIAVVPAFSVGDTLRTLVDTVEPHQQAPTRQLLSRVLRGVVCLRLVARADGRGRAAIVEALVGTAKVAEAVRDNAEDAALERLMADGDYHGMATFDQALFRLFSEDVVSLDEALEQAVYPEDLRIAVQRAGISALR